ncbi:MAG: hypothetical protein ACI4UL_06590, partial [Muribaculaceae bacterium]
KYLISTKIGIKHTLKGRKNTKNSKIKAALQMVPRPALPTIIRDMQYMRITMPDIERLSVMM